jgi:hypothetical protein
MVKRSGSQKALWAAGVLVLATIIPGGFVALSLYGAYRAYRARKS